MLEQIIQPAFYDTDALGHINNTALPKWFELARIPIFKIFTPDLDPKKWRLIVVNIEVAFKAQLNYIHPVSIHTGIHKIGNSSFVVKQTCIQQGNIGAQGLTTMVCYDYDAQQSVPLSDEERASLEQYTMD